MFKFTTNLFHDSPQTPFMMEMCKHQKRQTRIKLSSNLIRVRMYTYSDIKYSTLS